MSIALLYMARVVVVVVVVMPVQKPQLATTAISPNAE
jgi:hypothetical protein